MHHSSHAGIPIGRNSKLHILPLQRAAKEHSPSCGKKEFNIQPTQGVVSTTFNASVETHLKFKI